jgi:hypothetical protein
MKLDQYIKELAETYEQVKQGRVPEEALTERHGIYDNWPILLRPNLGKSHEELVKSAGYRLGINRLHKRIIASNEKIRLSVTRVNQFLTTNCNGSKTAAGIKHYQHQLTYPSSVTIVHERDEDGKEKIEIPILGIAHVVLDLIRKIPDFIKPTKDDPACACLPFAVQFDRFISSEDYSRVVYYPDDLEQRMSEVK